MSNTLEVKGWDCDSADEAMIIAQEEGPAWYALMVQGQFVVTDSDGCGTLERAGLQMAYLFKYTRDESEPVIVTIPVD